MSHHGVEKWNQGRIFDAESDDDMDWDSGSTCPLLGRTRDESGSLAHSEDAVSDGLGLGGDIWLPDADATVGEHCSAGSTQEDERQLSARSASDRRDALASPLDADGWLDDIFPPGPLDVTRVRWVEFPEDDTGFATIYRRTDESVRVEKGRLRIEEASVRVDETRVPCGVEFELGGVQALILRMPDLWRWCNAGIVMPDLDMLAITWGELEGGLTDALAEQLLHCFPALETVILVREINLSLYTDAEFDEFAARCRVDLLSDTHEHKDAKELAKWLREHTAPSIARLSFSTDPSAPKGRELPAYLVANLPVALGCRTGAEPPELPPAWSQWRYMRGGRWHARPIRKSKAKASA